MHRPTLHWILLPVILGGLLLSSGCRVKKSDPAQGLPLPERPRLDGSAAFKEVEGFVALGPKVAGSDGMEQAARHLASRLSSFGLRPTIDRFSDETPAGTTAFRNVLATVPGEAEGIIVLASHTDTKGRLEGTFVGANDSGSSTGLLLELARLLNAQPWTGPDLMFAFLDGEECHTKYGLHDGLHGSRHLVEQLREQGRLKSVRAALILDMIGDRDLNITFPRNCSPELVSLAFQAAREEGRRYTFKLEDFNVLDDHVPFLNAGVPTVNLIDFQYGSTPGGNEYWHTPEDTLDKLSPDSLELIGNVTLRMVYALAAQS